MTEFRFSRTEDRPALTALWQQAFGDENAFIDGFFETGYAPERSRVAVWEGRLAGMLYWFDCDLQGQKIAYVYAVATEKTLRGRGIATGLMEDVHSLLRKQGYAAVVLSPGSEGLYRFYGNMGYVTAGYRRELTFGAGTPIPVRETEPGEYALLRRALLPENGIRQEGVSLAFLHRFARFYAGEGFCATVSRAEPFCMEFLGQDEQIPGFLGAIGLREALVRGPGGMTPNAMVKRFRAIPSGEDFYLGFPFD